MAKNITDITTAAAGIFQACSLVKQAARTNQVDSDAYECSIQSIFSLEANSVQAVYQHPAGLKLGFQTFLKQFGSHSDTDPEIVHYVVSVLFVEKLLTADNERINLLGKLISDVEQHIDDETPAHDPIIVDRLAHAYTQCISTLGKRIHVRGEPDFINDLSNVKRIRALLLSAVRSAVLWRQLGGSKWHMLFFRKKYLAAAKNFA